MVGPPPARAVKFPRRAWQWRVTRFHTVGQNASRICSIFARGCSRPRWINWNTIRSACKLCEAAMWMNVALRRSPRKVLAVMGEECKVERIDTSPQDKHLYTWSHVQPEQGADEPRSGHHPGL